MPPQAVKGPFCQSCSMPLSTPEDFGTDLAGFRVNDYCRHCYADGRFTEPDITLPEMIDRCVTIMEAQHIMPAAQARALLSGTMPMMKRWNTGSCAL